MALRLRHWLTVGGACAVLALAARGLPVVRTAVAEDPPKPAASAAPATPAASEKPAEKPSGATDAPSPETDPLGANGACYVCHMTFVKEPLAKVHLAEKIACVKCHGLSAKHANDENIGATKPDITYRRDQVDKNCQECHDSHDVPPAKIVARFVERKLAPNTVAICTDCHGSHKIDRTALGK